MNHTNGLTDTIHLYCIRSRKKNQPRTNFPIIPSPYRVDFDKYPTCKNNNTIKMRPNLLIRYAGITTAPQPDFIK